MFTRLLSKNTIGADTPCVARASGPQFAKAGETPALQIHSAGAKRAWAAAAACGLCLALGAIWAPAQQAPAPQQPPRKAKKVWTNEDIERKPADTSQLAPASKMPSPELLQELQEIEDSARRILDELEPRRDAILAEVKELEPQRDAATSPEAQALIVRKIEAKKKELEEVSRQLSPARWQLKEVQKKREDLLAPPAPPSPLKDAGTPAPGESASKKEKKEAPKPAPPQ